MAKKKNKDEEDLQATEPDDSAQVGESPAATEEPVVESASVEEDSSKLSDAGETAEAQTDKVSDENESLKSEAGGDAGASVATEAADTAETGATDDAGNDKSETNEAVDSDDAEEVSVAEVVEKPKKKMTATKKKDTAKVAPAESPEKKSAKKPAKKQAKKKTSKKAKASIEEEVKNLVVVDSSGSSVEDISLNAAWLERERGDDAVHATVVAFLAGERSGTASTKTRSEVRGGGAKPWRQKGTGRARAGSNRSPIWRGGGVIFGPSPRDYSKKVNKKVRQLALRRAFTSRIDNGDVIVVDEFSIEEPKTRLVVSMLNGIGAGEDALLVIENSDNINAILGASNLPQVGISHPAGVNVYQLLLFQKVVFTRKAFEAFADRLA